MALLQIKEPNQTDSLAKKNKSQKPKLAVGIDLGTTFSLVARIDPDNEISFFKKKNQTIIPSVAAYSKDSQYFGYEALEKTADSNFTIVHSVKRLIGVGLDKIANPDYFPYDLSKNNQNNLINIHTHQGVKNPIEVSADLLTYLKEMVFEEVQESDFQKPLDAIITVPAYFDDSQRQATKDAAKIAGINVLRIINEPTAAALSYGLDQNAKGVFAVYDIGGGTFDFSILKMQKEIFQVLATSGDSALGGNDFDQILISEILQQIKIKADQVSDRDLFQLWQRAKEIKHCLTENEEIATPIKLGNQTIDFAITRKKFETLIEPLIIRSIEICKLAFKDSKTSTDQIDGVVMVGGSSRIPLIEKKLKQTFNCPIYNNLDPDLVVTKGAAIQANHLIGNKNNNALLLDITPLSLGIEIMGELVEKIIHRNTPIPIQKSQFFTTFKDNQTAISIHILQGERERVKDCRSLARFSVKGLVPMKASSAKLEVTFQLDADGILIVSAFEHKSKKQAEVMVKPSYGLDENEIERMIESSYQNARSDTNFRKKKNSTIKAKRLVEELKSALKQDSHLLEANEKEMIEKDIEKINLIIRRSEMTEKQREKLHQVMDDLTKKANQFADKRLKQNLSQLNQ